ncbi:carboxypeptidase-like regulatory domain-containing protein [Pricia sp. S334]|uniref:Carboxypeptidase-like regulatory domain-containing protein n=1 Tax=Pricia mediterranea TaxID=3076079 RepID=A0ABU3L8A8_9FLAO|nr:carboxypeptidase-like regulatory domain-containing protein [Pricia sp. S334]MDT7829712.1 carboxypeptidase-like regulatory domain-containing protein [Pricia sp. S334]
MKRIPTLIFLLFAVATVFAQDDGREILRGAVLYRNVPVPNQNVINIDTENAVISNDNGEFAIRVKVGDQLAFSAVNYQLEVVEITDAILANERLVVEVNEKVTELDEVVVSPENREKFLDVQNERFGEVEYEIDRSTEVENIAQGQMVKGMKDGINFVNIFKALAKAGKKDDTERRPRLKMSEVLRQVYEDEFFVVDLKLPQDKIDDFLYYVDETHPDYSLLLKDNEFQLLDFLVDESKAYREQMEE